MKRFFPVFLALSLSLHAEPVPIEAAGGAVKIGAGDWTVAGGQRVHVGQAAALPVTPGPIVTVKDEPLKLSAEKPEGYKIGTRLRGCNAKDVNAFGSLRPESVQVRTAPGGGGELLREGEDYLLEHGWASLGIGPRSRVTTSDTVYVSYQYAQMRADTVEVSPTGEVKLKAGTPHVSSPEPAAPDAGWTPVGHVLVNYGATAVTAEDIYPISETPAQAITATTRGRIPKTLAKLRAGQPVTIVCWGDSVTAGGNASVPEKRYVDVFAAGLKERFPQSQLNVQNISAGGSSSGQWLYPEKQPYKGLKGDANPARFERVLAAKPDLVTIEFVNDARLSPAQVEERYSEILSRLAPLGTEVILITPHFTMWSMMGFESMREPERRPYVLALREFATKHRVGLADAAARWEHLWKEGVPYLTLLNNTINHPDDRGHRLFAEELWKCFE